MEKIQVHYSNNINVISEYTITFLKIIIILLLLENYIVGKIFIEIF